MKKRISTVRAKSRARYSENKKARMHLDTKTGALIIAAAAVFALILVAAVVSRPNLETSGGNGTHAGSTPTYAPQGQFISGLPKELILDSAAQASNSYSIHYSSTNQYTAEWNSSMTMNALYAAYQNYFQNNQWKIANAFANGSGMRGIYAKKGSTTANVSMTAQKSGSHVIMTYLR